LTTLFIYVNYGFLIFREGKTKGRVECVRERWVELGRWRVVGLNRLGVRIG
jgi:hypothetical protein